MLKRCVLLTQLLALAWIGMAFFANSPQVVNPQAAARRQSLIKKFFRIIKLRLAFTGAVIRCQSTGPADDRGTVCLGTAPVCCQVSSQDLRRLHNFIHAPVSEAAGNPAEHIAARGQKGETELLIQSKVVRQL